MRPRYVPPPEPWDEQWRWLILEMMRKEEEAIMGYNPGNRSFAVTTDRIQAAAAQCPQAADVLKTMFPEAFPEPLVPQEGDRLKVPYRGEDPKAPRHSYFFVVRTAELLASLRSLKGDMAMIQYIGFAPGKVFEVPDALDRTNGEEIVSRNGKPYNGR